jgi:hypothetical protein
MLLNNTKIITAFASSVLLLIASRAPRVEAGCWKYWHCEPSPEVFHSAFFGYYPTCWRTWPPGQPACPPAILLPAQPLPEPATEKPSPPKEVKPIVPEKLKSPEKIPSPDKE